MFQRIAKRSQNRTTHVEDHGVLNPIKGYATITKIDEDNRIVIGVMTKATLDNQNEIVEWDATVEAVEDFRKWMNLREMHNESKASGVIKNMTLDHENKLVRVEAEVVDDGAWKKVKKGVYKGFSIGGKALERVKEFVPTLGKVVSKVKKYILNEVSLVDRPAHPECLFEVVKRDGNYNDPLYRELMTAERKVPVFKSKVMTDSDIARLPDSVFGLVKVRRTRNGLFKRRYYCMPDKIHAHSVLNVLSNSTLSKRDRFKVHDKVMKVLGKSHRKDRCPFCFEIQKYQLLSEVNSKMDKRRRRLTEAEALLKQAGYGEEYEGTTPHDRPVESEALRDAGRRVMNRNVPSTFQDDQEGDYDYYPVGEEEEYEGEDGYDGLGYPVQEEYEGENYPDEYEEDFEGEDVPEGMELYEDEEGNVVAAYPEDMEGGWDGNQGYENLGAGGQEERRTHLYSEPVDRPIDSEDREGEYYPDEYDEGFGKSASCPYCDITISMAMDAAKRGDLAKSSVQCPGCNEIYNFTQQVQTSVSSPRFAKAAGDVDYELAKRDDMIERLAAELQKALSVNSRRPMVRKMSRATASDVAEAEEIVKSETLQKDVEKAVALKKSGTKLTPQEEKFCEDTLDRSLEKKTR